VTRTPRQPSPSGRGRARQRAHAGTVRIRELGLTPRHRRGTPRTREPPRPRRRRRKLMLPQTLMWRRLVRQGHPKGMQGQSASNPGQAHPRPRRRGRRRLQARLPGPLMRQVVWRCPPRPAGRMVENGRGPPRRRRRRRRTRRREPFLKEPWRTSRGLSLRRTQAAAAVVPVGSRRQLRSLSMPPLGATRGWRMPRAAPPGAKAQRQTTCSPQAHPTKARLGVHEARGPQPRPRPGRWRRPPSKRK